jgi:hypothetical protein
LSKEPEATTIIEGGALGADRLARKAALSLGFSVVTVMADWSIGKRAGPIRNGRMLDLHPAKVIAFHEDLPSSKGTRDCVNQAKARGVEVEVITGTAWE